MTRVSGCEGDELLRPETVSSAVDAVQKVVSDSGDTDPVTSTSNINGESSAEPKPKAMHKTLSIFLRNLAPTITQQEVEAVR